MKKERKILDISNVCKCGKSGSSTGNICPLNEVIPPFDISKKCNCCNVCYSKCALEV
jgi:hypothetical protein